MRRRGDPSSPYDLGRERRAERRARALLRSIVPVEDFAMYEELGFISVAGSQGAGGYAYLLYPHRPLVAYLPATGRLVSEYCVSFREGSGQEPGRRLPDADDVLAKWISLRGNELELIMAANLNAPGHQLDPVQVRRDLRSLSEWQAARALRAAV